MNAIIRWCGGENARSGHYKPKKYFNAVHYKIKIEDIVIIRSDKGGGQQNKNSRQ